MTVKAIVLAAGQGTRMKSDAAKVLHRIAGRPLVSWVMDVLAKVDVAETVVVVGHQADEVAAILPDGAFTAHQEHRLGTGHAATVGLDALAPGPDDTILVLPGDMPLLQSETLVELVDLHHVAGAVATVLSAEVDDPTGYGRVLRDGRGRVVGIVEDADATPDQKGIREINTSVYAFTAGALRPALGGVDTDNVQGEHYLTDVLGLLASRGKPLAAIAADPAEALGVNSHDQLASAASAIRRRINLEWMRQGVWMLDPERVYVDATVRLAAGVRLYPDVYLEGETTVAAGAEIGPDVYMSDSHAGPDSKVWYAVVRDSTIGAGAAVGPYASLRGGTDVGESAKIGTFVETKKTLVGRGSKVPHLAYMGDATIGEGSNIGAGSITCNWDGVDKHPTTIGDRVFVGSDTMLVAPVEIGDDATTGAGSVITRDVTPGSLAVERSQQKEVPGYAEKRQRRKAQRAEREQDR